MLDISSKVILIGTIIWSVLFVAIRLQVLESQILRSIMYRTRNDIYATQIDTYRTFSVQKAFESWDPISGSPYDEYDDIIPSVLSILMEKNRNARSQASRLVQIMKGFEASVSCFVTNDVRKSAIEKLLELDMENPAQNLNEQEIIDMERIKGFKAWLFPK